MGALLLNDMLDYLTSGSVGLTSGTNLFGGFMPETPNFAVAVYESGGLGPLYAMNAGPGTAAVERPRVQVVARSTDYRKARQAMHNVFQLLDMLPRRTINGTQYHWGSAVQSPFLFGRDDAERVMIACNFDIVKDLSTSTST